MTALIFLLAIFLSVVALVTGDWGAILAVWFVAGLVLFLWQAICDAGQDISQRIGWAARAASDRISQALRTAP
jgi:hypothetical protein